MSIERWTVTVEQRAETVSASVEFVSLQRWLRTVFTITVRQDRDRVLAPFVLERSHSWRVV